LVDASRWHGKKVIDSKGNVVGEVEIVDIDTEKWVVTGFQVGLTNEAALDAGYKRPAMGQIIVVVPTDLVGSIGDFITIKGTTRDLKDLTKYLGWR
jgi:sporulation protein YlmC with PRC-barrel domain